MPHEEDFVDAIEEMARKKKLKETAARIKQDAYDKSPKTKKARKEHDAFVAWKARRREIDRGKASHRCGHWDDSEGGFIL